MCLDREWGAETMRRTLFDFEFDLSGYTDIDAETDAQTKS